MTVHVLTAAMETWVEAGAPASGPPFEECLALARRQVEELLGRSSAAENDTLRQHHELPKEGTRG